MILNQSKIILNICDLRFTILNQSKIINLKSKIKYMFTLQDIKQYLTKRH
jgi:hypothetical protein